MSDLINGWVAAVLCCETAARLHRWTGRDVEIVDMRYSRSFWACLGVHPCGIFLRWLAGAALQQTYIAVGWLLMLQCACKSKRMSLPLTFLHVTSICVWVSERIVPSLMEPHSSAVCCSIEQSVCLLHALLEPDQIWWHGFLLVPLLICRSWLQDPSQNFKVDTAGRRRASVSGRVLETSILQRLRSHKSLTANDLPKAKCIT